VVRQFEENALKQQHILRERLVELERMALQVRSPLELQKRMSERAKYWDRKFDEAAYAARSARDELETARRRLEEMRNNPAAEPSDIASAAGLVASLEGIYRAKNMEFERTRESVEASLQAEMDLRGIRHGESVPPDDESGS
jgi:hypothetical protein